MSGLRSQRRVPVLRRSGWRWLQVVAACSALLWSHTTYAYGGEQHQQLMFIAARQYNECVRIMPERRLSALQVRYAARAAVGQADASFLRRMFRWGFYEREQQAPKSTLWVIETRMHEHFNELLGSLERADKPADQFGLAGRIAAYVQDVTSPVRTVPIYTSRFWRFNTSDRFDNYSLNERDVEAALAARCEQVMTDTADYQQILDETAAATLAAVQDPIPGMPTTWQAFWKLAGSPADFGEYGAAGNRFGLSTTFRCGDSRCVLLDDDPLYEEFALSQHVLAVTSTMRVLHRLQMVRAQAVPETTTATIADAESDAAP